MQSLSAHELRALMTRAERNRQKLGPQRRHGRPGLPPSGRCDPAFVTGLDLVDFPQALSQSHRRELLRRRVPCVTPPVDVLELSWLALFYGLIPGGGTWVQLPVRQEEGIVGYGESTLQASHKRLLDRGFIERQEQMRELKWFDEDGRVHFLLEVWAKMRITPAGLAYLRTLGESRRVITMISAHRPRVSVVVGLASWLLKACGGLLRMLARRFAGAFEKKAPPKGKTREEEEPVGGAPARLAPVSSTAATGPPSRTHGPSPPDAGGCGSMRKGLAYQRAEIVRLKGIQATTVMQGYAPLYWHTDRYGRRTLERQFRELYQAELHRWFVGTSTPAMRLIQQRRDAEDAELLDAFEAAEPSESEKRVQFHNYGRRWQPTGRGVPGGCWVSAGASRVEELKKQQAADRADGVLEPKKPRRKRA